MNKFIFFSCFLLLSALCIGSIQTESQNKNIVTCALCKLLIGQIDDAIQDPTNEQTIEDILAGICNSLVGEIEIMCAEFIHEYTDDIIGMIVDQTLDPDTVCTTLAACP